jgi:hydroxymethylbilane synthase
MTNNVLRIGTRGSDLALWQARWAKSRLGQTHPEMVFEIVVIKTKGDKILDSPLSAIGDKGLFTREIEQQLLEARIDLAVHSLKDLPTELPHGLAIGAISEREDIRDAFIPHPGNPRKALLEQGTGAMIATGSLRRACQLLALRPDFQVIDIRGNLNTRFQKLERSDWAGMLLARAGVVRLGREQSIGEALATSVILPAVGQGALGIEIRSGDDRVRSIVRVLDHTPTRLATLAERALLRSLEGGCQIPVGAYGRVETRDGRDELVLDAMVGSLDGTSIIRGTKSGSPDRAADIGIALAEELLGRGARAILDAIRKQS